MRCIAYSTQISQQETSIRQYKMKFISLHFQLDWVKMASKISAVLVLLFICQVNNHWNRNGAIVNFIQIVSYFKLCFAARIVRQSPSLNETETIALEIDEDALKKDFAKLLNNDQKKDFDQMVIDFNSAIKSENVTAATDKFVNINQLPQNTHIESWSFLAFFFNRHNCSVLQYKHLWMLRIMRLLKRKPTRYRLL